MDNTETRAQFNYFLNYSVVISLRFKGSTYNLKVHTPMCAKDFRWTYIWNLTEIKMGFTQVLLYTPPSPPPSFTRGWLPALNQILLTHLGSSSGCLDSG